MTNGPFPPQRHGLGGSPNVMVDVPINAGFLTLFTFAAMAHFGLFIYNMKRKDITFPFSAATMGFCITRMLATSLRIAWAYKPHDIKLAMTAQIFVYAGVIILIMSNLWWCVRIVRAQHPSFGWTKAFSALIPVPIVVSIVTVLSLITSVGIMFYLRGRYPQMVALRIQQTGGTIFAVFAGLPLLILLISTLVTYRRSYDSANIDNFGNRRVWHGTNTISKKVMVCGISGLLLCTGATFRAVTSFLGPIHTSAPTPWYLNKICFYVFNFGIEIIVVCFWFIIRVDQMFHTPNGTHGPRSYGNQFVHPGEQTSSTDLANQLTAVLADSHSGIYMGKLSCEKSARSSFGGVENRSLHDSVARNSMTSTVIPVRSSWRTSWGPEVRSLMSTESERPDNEQGRMSWNSFPESAIGTAVGGGEQAATKEGEGEGEGEEEDGEMEYVLPGTALSSNDAVTFVSREGLESHLSLHSSNRRSQTIRVVSRESSVSPVKASRRMGFDPETGTWVKRHQPWQSFSSMTPDHIAVRSYSGLDAAAVREVSPVRLATPMRDEATPTSQFVSARESVSVVSEAGEEEKESRI